MSHTSALLLALASFQSGSAPDWIQLLPKGTAQPMDDRAAWQVSDPAAIALASKAYLPMLIDTDHALDLLPKGSSIPAFGWIEEIAGQGPAGEDGVWGKVDWTPLGKKALAGREYRFISPVFFHGETSRDIRVVIRATLTNDPALPQKALASRDRTTQTENDSMSLAKIAAALSLAAAATEVDILGALTALSDEKKALASRLTAIGTAAGLTGAIDDNAVLALAAKLKTPLTAKEGFVPQADFDKLQLDLASLQKTISGDKAETVVDAAIKGGKLIPAQRDWAIGYASREPAAFTKFIADQPVILPGGRTSPVKATEGELDADQKAICSALGVSEADFKKERATKAAAKKEAA